MQRGWIVCAGALLVGPLASAELTVQSEFSQYHRSLEDALDAMLERATHAASPSSDSLDPEPAAPGAPIDVLQSYAARHWRGNVGDLKRALARIDRNRPVIEPILAREGVPREMLAVILVESAGDPEALSPKQARGLWQFIPATARRYGLKVDSRRDERLDIARATTVAARYLKDLHGLFGNWPLVLAAYNAGEGAVQRALAQAVGTTFNAIRSAMPAETRAYVPAVLDAMHLFAEPFSRAVDAGEGG